MSENHYPPQCTIPDCVDCKNIKDDMDARPKAALSVEDCGCHFYTKSGTTIQIMKGPECTNTEHLVKQHD